MVNEAAAFLLFPCWKINEEVVLSLILLRMLVCATNTVGFVMMFGVAIREDRTAQWIAVKVEVDLIIGTRCVVQTREGVQHSLACKFDIADRFIRINQEQFPVAKFLLNKNP